MKPEVSRRQEIKINMNINEIEKNREKSINKIWLAEINKIANLDRSWKREERCKLSLSGMKEVISLQSIQILKG